MTYMIVRILSWLSVARQRRLVALVGAALALSSGAQAEDWTFREFPLQRVPSPEQLNRLLSAVQAESTEFSNSADVVRGPGPDIAESLPRNMPQLSPEQRRRLEQLLEQSKASIGEWVGDRRSESSSPSRAPAPTSNSVPSRGQKRDSPSPTGGGDTSSRLTGDGIDVQGALQLLNRKATDERPSRSDDGGGGLDRADAEKLLRHAESLAGEFSRIDRSRSIARESRQSRIARGDSGAGSPKWQGALGGEWNRILVGAAQRAGELGRPSAENTSAGSPFAGEFLDGLVGLVQRGMDERPANGETPPSRVPREAPRDDSEESRGFPWSLRWPDVQTPGTAPVPGGSTGPSMRHFGGEPLWLLAIPSCLALFLAAFWARARTSGRDASRSTAVLLARIESSEDLVQAIDMLLMTRYGAEASWWDCRAVERALVHLRPDRRVAMSRLATYYRRARYAPRFRQLTEAQLKHSARMLQRLAGPLNPSPEGVRNLHTAA